MPRDPNTLSQERLAEIVVCIQATLWFDDDAGEWNPDKEWSPGSDFLEAIADQLTRACLRPAGLIKQPGHTLDGKDIYLDQQGSMVLRGCSCPITESEQRVLDGNR